MQIHLEKTLDVEVVERQLSELWRQTSGSARESDDFAVLRSRVANLMVYVEHEISVTDVNAIIAELTAMHPSRVLLMLGETEKPDRDIQLLAETFCQSEKRSGASRLCCEEITLHASGRFVSELPSAALPLLVPDLTTFLWWQAPLSTETESADKVFDALLKAGDRLVIDSADFVNPLADLQALTGLFNNDDYAHVGISDLNWARLTSWRALLAGFYDVPAYQRLLAGFDTVRIDYLAPAPSSPRPDASSGRAAIAPQALLIAGWLASRLGWTLADEQNTSSNDETRVFNFANTREGADEREIRVELRRVEHEEGKPGRLVRVELQSSSSKAASFVVERSLDNVHLITEARVMKDVHRGRVMPVRNRSAAQLLGREMEILCNDQIYQEAVITVAQLIDRLEK